MITGTNKTLNSRDLFDLAEHYNSCADAVKKYWLDNLTTLSSDEISNLQMTESRLRSMSLNIRAAAIKSVLTDLADPAQKLKNFTDQIKRDLAAVARLNNALNNIAKFIRFGSDILNVISNLIPPPVKLP